MVNMVIEHGTVVTPVYEARMDVGVTDGTVTQLAAPGTLGERANETIDATDRYVFPGFLDSHVHAKLELGAFTTGDKFDDLTGAAAIGGTTTIVPFAIPDPDETPLDALDRRQREAAGDAYVDYAFHGCVTDATPETLREVPELIARGAASVKTFMVYEDRLRLDDGELRRVMGTVADANGMLLVHAENNEIIASLVAERTVDGPAEFEIHPETHPAVSETAAMWTVAELVAETDCPTLLVHASTAGARNVLEAATTRGLPLVAETCPHYLALTEDRYEDPDGERYVCSPPLRASAHRGALWELLADGHLSMVNSDHCGYTTRQKAEFRDDVTQIPNGLPGV
ncbi:amidohydrolase family protein [Halorarum salinum]|uniref:Amidohydrolase family protein n=1 Tax=Halorarum salinum TaxID=2743089 RepID=A0A7D5L8S9_9EURY|nr:amidohydrolase family protein [Halobaculum salinum]